MIFVGDVHREFDRYRAILDRFHPDTPTLQVGDMGVFGKKDFYKLGELLKDQPNHRFIRGNHDNPTLCQKHPNYLGDAGYISEIGLFYVAGGYSIDKHRRTPGIDWWQDEQLSYSQLTSVMKSFQAAKPKIVVSHECPAEVMLHVITNKGKLYGESRTESALQQMFEMHRPDFWVFGHHHQKKIFTVKGTIFVCLGEMIHDLHAEDLYYEIADLEWPADLLT